MFGTVRISTGKPAAGLARWLVASITLAVFARPDVGLIQKAREIRLIFRLVSKSWFVRWLRFGMLLHIAWLMLCRPDPGRTQKVAGV